MNEQVKEIETWRNRIGENNPKLCLEKYVGRYYNQLYGSIDITKIGSNKLKIKFNSHKNLSAILEYMDNEEWLMTYDPISNGIFKTKFEIGKNKVNSINIKVSDFIEFDAYKFTKAN